MSEASLTPILLTLPSFTPSLAVEVLPHGLTLHRFFVQTDGRTHDLVIGPEDPKGHLAQKYTNTIVGRYTNRLPVGTHAIARNGASATVRPQANESPAVSLHGGPAGFDAAAFEPVPLDALAPGAAGAPVTAASPPGALFTEAELGTLQTLLPQGAGALFRHVSEDGDQGFPGTLLVEVVVGLLPPNGPATGEGEVHLGSVVFIYRAKLVDDGPKIVTPINLTQHWGFNLDASLKEGPDPVSIKDNKLTIKASHTVDIDSSGLATGNLIAVAGTPHQHDNKPIVHNAPVGDGSLGSGYGARSFLGHAGPRLTEHADHFYVFEERPKGPASVHRIPVAEFTPSLDIAKAVLEAPPANGVVDLSSEKSGLRLVFNTNQSGVQFYTNNLSKKTAPRKKIHGGTGVEGEGQGYGQYGSAFLEFHEPIATFLHPSTNPSGNDTLLAQGEIYNNFVRVDVLYKSKQV
ncbi:galactose mutarotase-like protein [Auriscalpium vulgare]|uniref:Galactose mutarotase-like protein n=1 Tax=Auriscalpium vulgare TaxID=40419 RepID=A0ACB8RK61_9AGAM|nr:galactose mutarotase-like protein [Auriscalpium vulgare]